MSENQKNSGRVSTQQFYEALLKQNDRMDNMERRILERVDRSIEMQQEYQNKADARFAADYVRLDALEGNVENLEKWDKRIGVLSVIGNIIASAIGIEK